MAAQSIKIRTVLVQPNRQVLQLGDLPALLISGQHLVQHPLAILQHRQPVGQAPGHYLHKARFDGIFSDVRRCAALPECPVATTVQLIGSKWKLLILRNLLARPWRFNELRKSLDGISQKVLTDSLRSMEEDGIITRTVYPEVPPRVEYALSELGESMRPIIKAMEDFGSDYKKQTV